MNRCRPAPRFGFRNAELVLPEGENWSKFSRHSKYGKSLKYSDSGLNEARVSSPYGGGTGVFAASKRKVPGGAIICIE